MKFRVIDNKTGKEADAYEIALHEEWAQSLVYCDMEGFAITEDGYLVLMDECGHVVYCDTDRFKVVFEYERPQWIPCSERLPEDDKEVLVYVRRKDGEKSEMNGLHIARRHQMEGDPEGNNNFWGVPVAPCEWRIEGWSYFFEPEVLAWMPLPEPYKEGDKK